MASRLGTALTDDSGRYEGSEWVGVITAKDEDGTAVNITSATEIEFYITYGIGGAVLLTKLFTTGGITKSAPASGQFTVTIDHTDTVIDSNSSAVTGRLAYEAYVTIGGNRWICARNLFDHHATKY